MAKPKAIHKVIHHTKRVGKQAASHSIRIAKVSAKAGGKVAVVSGRTTKKVAVKAHYHLSKQPHQRLMAKGGTYSKWHSWRWHKHVHGTVAGVYVVLVGVIVFNTVQSALAADLTDNWDFTTAANYTIDSGIETSGSAARLKAQEYTTDGNTAALYNLNESSGTSIADASANSNTGTANTAPTWGTGNLNGAASLNGTNQRISAADSSSLSLTGQHSLEGWFKPSSTFDTSANQNMGILDKGSYKVGLDRTSGKLTYEAQNSAAGSGWTRRLGNGLNNSWTVGHVLVGPSVAYGSDVYATTSGILTGEGEVWRWNGTSWTKVGGDGINSSWADDTYEAVSSIAVNGTALYAGLGTGSGDGEVWTCELSTNCTTWSKIGGDGTGPSSAMETISAMTTYSGSLYVGTGSGTNDAMVWKYNGGTSWTQIGGVGLNSSWNTNYEAVFSLASDATYLYAGLGSTTTDAEVWRWNGTAWSQIGGDGLNSSWNTNYETVQTLTLMGGNVYAGLGTGAGDGEVWRWNGTAWSQIGGDSLNSSWGATGSQINSAVTDGSTLYMSVQVGAAGEIWTLTGSTTWTRVGANLVNGFPSASGVTGLALANSKVYVGYGTTSSGAYFMEWTGSGNWSYIGGRFLNGSWGGHQIGTVVSSTTHNGKAYFGIGVSAGEVYEYDGSTATMVGGEGLNSSWAFNTYESVTSMISYNGSLYAGLGTGTGDGEVWRYTSGSWTKVGGDSTNSSWSSATTIDSMAVYGGNLYAGVTTGSAGEVWRWNGTTWTRVGGSSTNSSWTTTQRVVPSMTAYDNQLCAGTETVNTAGNGNVWCYNGTTWTQIGGSSNLNSGWSSANSDAVATLSVYNGQLYAGVSEVTALNSSVWRWDGTSWTQVAGNGTASSWPDGTYSRLSSTAVYNGELYVGTGTTTAGNGDVWKYNGTSWSQAAGDSTNGSWTGGTIEVVPTLTVYKGKLYAGTGNTANADAQVWSVGNNTYLESTSTSFSNSWYHFAVTNDLANAKLYIGGIEQASASTASTPDNSLPLLIGTNYGSNVAGNAQGFFAGSLDEIRISSSVRGGFTTAPYSSTRQAITLNDAVRTTGVNHWDGLSSSETTNGGAITYRLSSDDGTTWKYWTGSAWGTSSATSQANDISTINTNIATFPVTFSGIKWQAVLLGDGTQQVQLNSVELSSTSDTTDPSANASSITALKANGGSSLASNGWTNGGSPYFSWTAGTDDDSGVLGYCLYLGTSSSGDPETTKGMLGTSSVDTGNNCPFAVSSTNIDLATSGYLGTALTSSSSPYYLNIKAIDNAGNISNASAQFQFRFDNTLPSNPSFVSAPSGFLNSKAATLTWPTSGGTAAADNNSGVAGLQYRIGSSGTWYGDDHTGSGDINDLLNNDGSYETLDPTDYDDLTDGINTIYFRTWDAAGNVTTNYVTAVLKINTTGAPSEPQNLEATPATNTTNSFSFEWDAPTTYNTTTGQPDKLSYCYTINTLPTVNNCTFTSLGQTSVGPAAFATQPGANTFYVVAKDDFGAINYASYTSTTFTANTSAPGMPINIDIVDVSVKTTSNWRLAVTWDQPTSIGAGIAAYRLFRSTDNSTFSQVGSSSATSYVDGGLTQQTYYYKVKACDSANNCGAESSVVSLLPTGKFTEPAEQTSEAVVSDITTKRATIAWNTSRASDSKILIGVTSGEYSASEVGNSSQVSAHTIELDNLAAGTTYYFKARWTDVDGNTGTSQEYTFTTAPAPVLKEVQETKVSLDSATLQFTTVDAKKVNLLFGKTDSFGGVKSINTSLDESTYSTDLEGLEDGTKYFYKLVMFDTENGEYQSSIFSFNTPPRPRISNLRFQPVDGEPTSTQKVTWETNIPTTTIVSYGKVNATANDVSANELKSSHEMVIRGLEDNSQYFLVAQGRDSAGNLATSDKQVFQTALDTRAPKVSDIVIEPTVRGSGAEARGQVVVTWKTDEPATSQVAYAEGSNATTFNNKTAEDAALTTDHLVIISELPTSKVYTIMPISKDKSGNGGQGDKQPAIVGRASDSVLNIVLNTLRKVFGL